MGRAFLSLDEVVTRILKNSYMKDNKTTNLLEGRTKEWDYYNRSSIHSSYQIIIVMVIAFIIVLIGWGVLESIKKVSNNRNDFDNTYNTVSYTHLTLPTNREV